jgi:hypothetical protein
MSLQQHDNHLYYYAPTACATDIQINCMYSRYYLIYTIYILERK